jgi:hypothetical protein
MNIANIFLTVGVKPKDSITTEFIAVVNCDSISVLLVLKTVIILPIFSSNILKTNQLAVLSSKPFGGADCKSSTFISTGIDFLPV